MHPNEFKKRIKKYYDILPPPKKNIFKWDTSPDHTKHRLKYTKQENADGSERNFTKRRKRTAEESQNAPIYPNVGHRYNQNMRYVRPTPGNLFANFDRNRKQTSVPQENHRAKSPINPLFTISPMMGRPVSLPDESASLAHLPSSNFFQPIISQIFPKPKKLSTSNPFTTSNPKEIFFISENHGSVTQSSLNSGLSHTDASGNEEGNQNNYGISAVETTVTENNPIKPQQEVSFTPNYEANQGVSSDPNQPTDISETFGTPHSPGNTTTDHLTPGEIREKEPSCINLPFVGDCLAAFAR